MKALTKVSFWQVWLIGIVLIGIRFYPALLEGKVTYFGDNYSLQVPGRVYSAYWLKQGIIPWWNPTIFAGIPWGQELSQTIFYPTTLLFMFLNPGTALNWSFALHLLFTFWGMFLLGKLWQKNEFVALIGAVLWTFSTQVTGASNNLVTMQAISWFPWIGYWGLRLFESNHNILIFSLFVLGQFLAGYPQHVIYAILLAVVLSFINSWKKIKTLHWLLRWLITAFITVGVTAVVWLPFIEIFLQSTRTVQTAKQANMGSLQPLMLVKFILPYFFDNPAMGMKWGPAWSGFPNVVFYVTWVGILILLSAIRRRHSVGLFLFIIFTIFISMGDNFFLFSLIQKIIPIFKVSRGPSIILICTNIALILVIIKELAERKGFHFQKNLVISPLLFGVFAFLMIVISSKIFSSLWNSVDNLLGFKLSQSQFHTLERDYILTMNILLDFLINSLLLFVVLIIFKTKKLKLAVLIIGIDMIFNTQGMLFFAPKNIYPSWGEIDQKILLQPKSLSGANSRTLTRNMNASYTDFAMYWEALTIRKPFSDSFINHEELQTAHFLKQLNDNYTPDWNMVYQVPVIHGYTTLLPKDYATIWEIVESPGINAIDKIPVSSELLSEWAVANYIVDKQFVIKEKLPDSTPIALSDTVDLYTLSALPRFRYEDNTSIDISSLEENPNTIKLTVDSGEHTELIIADRYDSNWKLKLNNEEQQIIDYEGMRKIELVQGQNYIEIQFIPQKFMNGLLISLISFFAGLVFIRLFDNKCVKY